VSEQDFIDMWVAFVNGDPNGDGTFVQGMGPRTAAFLLTQSFTSYGLHDDNWVMLGNGDVVISALEKDSALPVLSFLRRAYAAGAIDPDFVSYNVSNARQKFAAGQLGTILYQASPKHLKAIMDDWEEVQTKNFMDCVEILDPPAVAGKTNTFGISTAFWSESYINASVDDTKMAKILEIFDYFYTEEGMRLQMFGFEGEDYKMEGDEIVLLTEVNPDTGRQMAAPEIYRFSYGGMREMFAWSPDMLQYVDPAIPKDIRDVTARERDRRIDTWNPPNVDLRIKAIDIPERAGMADIAIGTEWSKFIVDTSDVSDSELFDKLHADWEANGYKAAKEGMTNKVAELGY
jgi:putative aldouronate transport system substrate-binding protein